jgi:hypothetical protein
LLVPPYDIVKLALITDHLNNAGRKEFTNLTIMISTRLAEGLLGKTVNAWFWPTMYALVDMSHSQLWRCRD